jgi:hypothetical protein
VRAVAPSPVENLIGSPARAAETAFRRSHRDVFKAAFETAGWVV